MLVESPHKAKAIGAFLPNTYRVMATVGSMFDIDNPSSEAEKQKYDSYGVDTQTWDRNLRCTNSKQFALIRNEVKSGAYDEIIVSTDPDRAGALIGQEIIDALSSEIKRHHIGVSRATWTEITKKAVEAGLRNKGVISQLEVAAAESRSVYDRLFGFAISGNVQRTLRERSSGRVQSPALRLIVQKEKERLAFRTANYLSIEGLFKVGVNVDLEAKLISLGHQRIAIGNSFDAKGVAAKTVLVLDNDNVSAVKTFLQNCTYEVIDVSVKPYSRRPPMPYTTSTFQQDVGNRLRLSSKQIMNVAQRLFDESFISYMRTDSPHLGEEALRAAHGEAVKLFGPSKAPKTPTAYKAKGQGGHEAIRPVCDDHGAFRAPKTVKNKLDAIDANAYRVYEAVYNRTVASQMNAATGFTTTVKIGSTNTPREKQAIFGTAATTYTDLGWMALTKPLEDESTANVISTTIEVQDPAELKTLTVGEHATKPPARVSEPQLVQMLSELNIGRPSTFATIVTINQDRGYVRKKGGQLYPTWAGFKVAQYLEGKIPNFVAYEASARLEDELDKIESGAVKKDPFLKNEWQRIQQDVLSLNDNIDWDEVNELSTVDLHNGYLIRVNAFGAWLENIATPLDEKGRRPGVKLADDENVAEYDFADVEVCGEIYQRSQNRAQSQDLGTLTSGEYAGWIVTARDGKHGPYVQAVAPEVKQRYDEGKRSTPSMPKPVNYALPETSTLATVTLDEVAPLFEEIKLPRWSPNSLWLVGVGKRGPYMGHRGSAKARPVFRSLPDGADPRTIEFEEVEKLWASMPEPKKTAKKATAKKTAAKTVKKTPAKSAKKTAAKKRAK